MAGWQETLAIVSTVFFNGIWICMDLRGCIDVGAMRNNAGPGKPFVVNTGK